MRWTWDPSKNEANIQKHRISFEDAELVFADPLFMTEADPYPGEERYRTTGMVNGVIVLVVHTLMNVDDAPDAEAGRIISARKATRRERQDYEESRH